MTGHEPLIAMRMNGRCPQGLVWIEIGKTREKDWRNWPINPDADGDLHPMIEVSRQDRLSSLDLRCVVGMRVVVQGEDEARTIRVAELVHEAKAKACYVTVYKPGTVKSLSNFCYSEKVTTWLEF